MGTCCTCAPRFSRGFENPDDPCGSGETLRALHNVYMIFAAFPIAVAAFLAPAPAAGRAALRAPLQLAAMRVDESKKTFTTSEGQEVPLLSGVELSELDAKLVAWGWKEDPRIPEECREPITAKIKKAGRAGVVSYAITELGFWVISVPLAVAAVVATTGSVPDFGTTEGKEAVAGYAFIFLNFARVIVPARIALALALTPWIDRNVVSKFVKDPVAEECEVD